MSETRHGESYVGTTRGDRDKRTLFYGYCTCGAGTTTSASQSSVRAKLRKHFLGDNAGMFRP